ncbi:MAG: 2-C-methyl-D-erythritol 4-phosphate cytidylyltransferase [Lachnospiraceae bacterium]|nr:2-C-methyl-D-erythritol 4-phosphate cytidylyltransferase [Lachnospiraceae bacterium]
MNFAILLSGGIGTRISSDIPKQYVCVGERMIVTFALESLMRSDCADAVYIVAEHEWRESILSDVREAGVDADKICGFADPGRVRQESILNGMQGIIDELKNSGMETGDDDTVLIHDAARPMLSGRMIEECYAALPGHDGVMPVLPMKDTVYMSDDGRSVSGLLDRSRVFAGQAPELFYFKPYYEAVRRLMPDKILKVNGASEPAVMVGMDIVMIPGDEGNFKITTDVDMERFRELMEGRE